MILDVIACALMWLAILLEGRKNKNRKSSLDNFGLLFLQILLVATAFIIMKSNPYA